MNDDSEHEWRCSTCGTLLGLERRGRLHLKYKTAQYVVKGPVMAVCRRCSGINEMTPRQPGTRAVAARSAV